MDIETYGPSEPGNIEFERPPESDDQSKEKAPVREPRPVSRDREQLPEGSKKPEEHVPEEHVDEERARSPDSPSSEEKPDQQGAA